jgi:hypothetical protein
MKWTWNRTALGVWVCGDYEVRTTKGVDAKGKPQKKYELHYQGKLVNVRDTRYLANRAAENHYTLKK